MSVSGVVIGYQGIQGLGHRVGNRYFAPQAEQWTHRLGLSIDAQDGGRGVQVIWAVVISLNVVVIV